MVKKAVTLVLGIIVCLTWTLYAQDKGELANVIRAMAKEKDPDKNLISMFGAIKRYKLHSIKDAEEIDLLKGQTALSFLQAKKHAEFEKYIGLIKNKFNQTSYLNMAADWLDKDATNLAYAEIIAKMTVDLYHAYKDDPAAKPTAFDLTDWNRFMKMAAYPYYQRYASILHRNGKNELALFYQEKALADLELSNLEQWALELYANLLELNGQSDKAYDLLYHLARSGKSNASMNNQLRKLHAKKTGNESSAVAFLLEIQKNLEQTRREEVARKKLHERIAPDFTLTDLNGKLVSLSHLKGKVVVLDFWATWCAPCIASLPTMQKLSEKHKDVVFLFIATQESEENAEDRIKSFLAKNKLSLNVLIDRPNGKPAKYPVAQLYQIKGIPAKMVIDRIGQLLFSTEGFVNESDLAQELEAMITIAEANY